MGVRPKEETKRNASIYADHLKVKRGELQLIDLVKKYNLTTQRIYQICQRYSEKYDR